MSEVKSTIGVQSAGDDINWKSVDGERIEDPIINSLVKEATALFINKTDKVNSINDHDISIYIENFNKFLKDNKYKFSFPTLEIVNETQKTKVKKPSNKELILKQIKDASIKTKMENFIATLVINNNSPIKNKTYIESFFSIVFWAINLEYNKKKTIDISFYLDCGISLFKSINDSKVFLTEEMVSKSYELLESIEAIIRTKQGKNTLFNIISRNLLLLLESTWDKIKPTSTVLYEEQKEIISLISSNLNEKKLVFFEMPPANGKTILSAILAKVIAHHNIPGKKKTVLYICYNTIVRNEVAKLCITHNIDLKYWLAVTKADKEDSIVKTFLRPFKNCYPDWNRKKIRTKKEEDLYKSTRWMRFSENIHDQWQYFINETRPFSDQQRSAQRIFSSNAEDIDYTNTDNLPEMIISDLDSAFKLLSEFPDTFVTYFDEAFAASNLEITSKIMSVLGLTVLVSATLAKPEEIPTVISNFKQRHNHVDNSFLHVIKSTKQHISCTFINEEGYIFSPHDNVQDLESLGNFIELLDNPLIRRAYSPEVVFNISEKINEHLPLELQFSNRFNFIGMINHDSLREYASDILKYIVGSNNDKLFQILKSIKNQKINNMDINTIFTENAIQYQSGKTLHVATSELFNNHIESISNPLLKGSPKISDIITMYDHECSSLNSMLQSLTKNGNKDSEHEKDLLNQDLSNTVLKFPGEFIMNSAAHAVKFKNYSLLNVPNNTVFAKKHELGLLSDTRDKLLLSGIGVYQPETFSTLTMDAFLQKKDQFKFIASTPSIVYGTNISLSIIDIDRSFLNDSTKNTLYQLIGRAGRKGKSHSAMIIFRDNRMLDMILQNDNVNIEAQQIERNFEAISAK